MKKREKDQLTLSEIDRKQLKDAIELVSKIDKVEWSGPFTKDKDGNDIMIFPFPIYPEGLFEALSITGIDRNYGENYKKYCEGVPIGEMSISQIRTMLTRMQRGERFCDGYIADEIENGNMFALLKRLDEILETKSNSSNDISIVIEDIVTMDTDCIVNAANEGLREGGGVCGAIFKAAGADELSEVCRKIGRCPTGSAVITPGFNLNAKYIIHAVGPVWSGSDQDQNLLRSCYKESLARAKENDCHTIAFPLISAGIFGCPIENAWQQAIKGCREWIEANPEYDIDIIFAVRKQSVKDAGESAIG